MGTQLSPTPKGAQLPIFGPFLLWPNGWMHQDATWHGGRPRARPHYARWGPSSPTQKKGHSPQFPAHIYCGQTAGWIKMPLGTAAGFGPGDIVLDGDPVSPRKRGTTALFSAHVYCGHGRPSQLLLSSCSLMWSDIICTLTCWNTAHQTCTVSSV